jgi:hypothetical protein
MSNTSRERFANIGACRLYISKPVNLEGSLIKYVVNLHLHEVYCAEGEFRSILVQIEPRDGAIVTVMRLSTENTLLHARPWGICTKNRIKLVVYLSEASLLYEKPHKFPNLLL